MKNIALSIFLLAGASLAQSQVTIKNSWVRGTVPQQQASGTFMQLSADRDIRLAAAKSSVAGVVEIHEMAMGNNVMKMRQIHGRDIVPGRMLELKPVGFHAMLINLKTQLKGGDKVPITLVFEETKTKKGDRGSVIALGAGNAPVPVGR